MGKSLVAFMFGPAWVPLADLVLSHGRLFGHPHVMLEELSGLTIFVYGPALLLGVPVLLVLRALHKLTPLRAAILGVVVGPLPGIALIFAAIGSMGHM